MVRDKANITIATREEVMYLSSNGIIMNVVHHDLDLYFQGQKIGNANIWKMVRANENAQL